MSLEIGPNKQVTMHFALQLDNGDVVDSTFDARPATFVVGDGNLPENFEQYLMGLTKGHKETFSVPPENGFGQSNPNNVQEIGREQFSDMELSEGLVVSFADAANTELPGIVKSFDLEKVVIDFNHPLAGKTLDFKVEILDVVENVAPDLAEEAK